MPETKVARLLIVPEEQIVDSEIAKPEDQPPAKDEDPRPRPATGRRPARASAG